ncbi:hypothetical protein TNCV_3095531 [Trichonephila clavipes]|uniref:Uncharacterized protein n=1 Tax=Trichonephila clavipes TaxID=2585209 RepID=A0A8X6WIQ4_TRICX|nr:hypothetical protein TNCV_3095531 [Trichonephila clavipes]
MIACTQTFGGKCMASISRGPQLEDLWWKKHYKIKKILDIELDQRKAFGDGPVAGVPGGQGIESWLAWLEFELSATKDPPCRAAMHVKSIES